ncbi:hypothetical protein [Amycolatopsis taiwanensis]|uniref:hypothetical protein n=1 Tax=Amycolatopsis taiwanensis TaxID=342230 RepID=UPI000488F310|nr:hypothetical protein [Amycolatopsis taiwanensis]
MSASLSGTLPGDDRNGLDQLARAFVGDPEGRHVIIALVDCTKITTKVDTGEAIPTLRVRAIEGFLGTSADGKEVRRLWRRAYERRTGQVELPLEVERELEFLGRDDA